MNAEFVARVADELGIARPELVEKDVLIHQLLSDVSENEFLRRSLVFKGGTCLIKHYLGYYRFSEDIDFTWKNQRDFEGKTQKQIRRDLARIIGLVGAAFGEIALKRGLDFRPDKSDRNYVELGGSNKSATFKIWYASAITGKRSFIKAQINFVEHMVFATKQVKLSSLVSGGKTQQHAQLLFPGEYRGYASEVAIEAYSAKEILCEKIRAILTRQGVKARDFLDAYFIHAKLGMNMLTVERAAVAKTVFSLNLYGKYRENFSLKKEALESGNLFQWGDEKALLLEEIDEKAFYQFIVEFDGFLAKVADKVSRKADNKFK